MTLSSHYCPLSTAGWGLTACLDCMGDLQGFLDTPGGEERVVLKRVKARVQVGAQLPALLG